MSETHQDLQIRVRVLYQMIVALAITICLLTVLLSLLAVKVMNIPTRSEHEMIRNEIADQAGIITAKGLVIVNDEGEVRADIGLINQASSIARIRLFDSNGTVRILLGTNDGKSGSIGFFNKDMKVASLLTENIIGFSDSSQTVRVSMGLPQGDPVLTLISPNSINSITMGCDDHRAAFGLTKRTTSGKGSAYLAIGPDDSLGLRIESPVSAKHAAGIGVDHDGSPHIFGQNGSDQTLNNLLPYLRP